MSLSDREKSFLAWIAVMLCLTAFSWESLWSLARFTGWLLRGLVALVIFLLVLGSCQRRRDITNYQRVFREIFGEPTAGFPKLEVGSCYGFDSFTILFATREEVAEPARQIQVARFKAEVQQMCAHQGSEDNPFDVDRTVCVSYDGELEERSALIANRLQTRATNADKPGGQG
ncbi:MAG: hypothetical protein JNM99_06190 [Verrucomicrobiaceae bacterium]|nr:hypothetical protein [Verrucomicrobiaceae bacterium]